MFYLALFWCIAFGGLGIFLITFAATNCTRHLFYVLNKKQTTGTVVGYQEEVRYTRQSPRQLIRRFHPKVQYSTDEGDVTGIAQRTRKNTKRLYSVGQVLKIGYHGKFVEHFVIVGNNKSMLLMLFPFVFGCKYLFLLSLFPAEIFNGLSVNTMSWVTIAIFSILAVQAVRLLIIAISTKVYVTKSWAYSIQGVIALVFACCAFAALH